MTRFAQLRMVLGCLVVEKQYVVWSELMAFERHSGYVKSFEPDHLNGSAAWGEYAEACRYTKADAVAIALAVSDHTGVGTPQVVDVHDIVDVSYGPPRNR